MVELDKLRDLTFDRGSMSAADGTPGLGIKIPITPPTREWSAAFHQLAQEQQVDVRLTPKNDQLILQVRPGTSREELLRRLNQTLDLINQASQLERDQRRDLLSATSPLKEVALDWWQRG